MASASILLRGIRPSGGRAVDMLLANGRILAVGDAIAPPADATVVEGAGLIALPGLVDGHLHLDKTLWGEAWRPHSAGPTVPERIENERRVRAGLLGSVAHRAGALIRQCVAHGTTALRTHVDIDLDVGLSGLHGVSEAIAAHGHLVDAEIVAFPQGGIVSRPGVRDLLAAALREGASVVGGVDPAGIDRDAAGQLDAIFDLAVEHGARIDIHLHDPGELGLHELELIVERTRAAGLRGRVAVSHAFCLGAIGEGPLARIAAALAEAGIAIMTHGPGSGPMPPVPTLAAAGVRMFSGSDNVRDLWSPFGNADMLERAWLVAYRQNLRTDDGLALALELATLGGAAVLGLDGYGLEAGDRADLVLVEGETLAEAIVARRPRRLVIKAGRIVARDGALAAA